MRTIFSASQVITAERIIPSGFVVVEDGVVAEVGARAEQAMPKGELHEYPEAAIAPGLVDIHIHGGRGVDVMAASERQLDEFGRFLLAHGVTSYYPTTVAAPLERIRAALERLGNYVRRQPQGTARALGIHLEGPFLSHARRGVHPPENLLAPAPELLEQFQEDAGGAIGIITMAPEFDGSLATIRRARKLNIVVSLGHTDATLQVSNSAIAAGASHATHTFNAMRPLHHREPGVLGAALTSSLLTADLIADGIHVAPELVKLWLRAKGLDKAVLITDAISATGMPDGTYDLGGITVEVKAGRALCQGALAGSTLTLDQAVRNTMRFAGISLGEALRLATANAAGVVSKPVGRIQAGEPADLIVLSSAAQIRQTWLAGKLAYSA